MICNRDSWSDFEEMEREVSIIHLGQNVCVLLFFLHRIGSVPVCLDREVMQVVRGVEGHVGQHGSPAVSWF